MSIIVLGVTLLSTLKLLPSIFFGANYFCNRTRLFVYIAILILVKWSSIYCAFHKHAYCAVRKPTDDCIFRCCQST